MVRLAFLLLGDRSVAESVVQRAFVVLVRRHDRRRDPGVVVADLRAHVVAECRAVRRGRLPVEQLPGAVRDTVGDVLGLPQRQREVVVLFDQRAQPAVDKVLEAHHHDAHGSGGDHHAAILARLG